ncbi:MAG TPA: DNA polymerase III subunit gamma/tau [Candidatus Saccharimonadales bacterium]|nr:DNA polymerase III subunit gamma/tau [Candidatus Saccharimonadales bacterium]
MNLFDVERKFVSRASIRPGVAELFELCQKHNIPTAILSAGVTNIIDIWCQHFGIHPDIVLSTHLGLTDEGHIAGWGQESMIHVLNKRERGHGELSVLREQRPNIILGGGLDDADMVQGSSILRTRVYDPRPDEKDSEAAQLATLQRFDLMLAGGSLQPLVDLIRLLATHATLSPGSVDIQHNHNRRSSTWPSILLEYMGKALYRTHRPRKLSEIFGQEQITATLEHALEKGTISHAYLFTGPRGVGKTSIARILAHEINGLPYDDDTSHLDIIEIDAASNRRIDEIRDLREKVHIAPTSAKYKVYIIDEVHMLTKEAFNALLKTLEEPPAHVIFMLATTESHKLPETIISRTQRFSLKPVDIPKVVAHLRHISDEEHIVIADDALQLIAEHGEGSFRDSISLLDQIRNVGREVQLTDVQQMLGIAPSELLDRLITAIVAGDGIAVAAGLQDIHMQGYEAAQVAKQLGQELRNRLLANTSLLPPDILLHLLGELVNVPASVDPSTMLEINLLEAALDISAPQEPIASVPTKPAAITQAPPPAVKSRPVVVTVTAKTEQTMPSTTALQPDETLNETVWPKVLDAIKGHHNTLYGIARAAQPRFPSDGTLVLELKHAFHKKQLDQKHNLSVIIDAIRSLTGQSVTITCRLGGENPASTATTPPAPTQKTSTPPQNAAQKDNTLESISNIFGSAELLES